CLLANLLGYEDHARLVAERLPVDDPVRRFAKWDLAGLRALAHHPGVEPRTEYLYLLRLAEGTTPEAWFSEFEDSSWTQRSDVASLRLILRLEPFSWEPLVADLMRSRILDELSVHPRGVGSPTPSTLTREDLSRNSAETQPYRLPEFEEAVTREASRLNGPLLDPEIVRGFLTANYYSSIHSEAAYFFDILGSTGDAEKLG